MTNLNKPVRTKDGRPVRIVCTDRKNDNYPVLALVTQGSGRETHISYTASGKYWDDGDDSEYDLVNVPEEKVTFLNVYLADYAYEYATLEDANRGAGKSRVGVLKLTRVDGKITKKELVG